MLDRKDPPINKEIKFVPLKNPNQINYKSFNIYTLRENNHDVIKFDIICDSGTLYEPYLGVATFAAKMLKGGTHKINNNELEQKLDYYGCNLNINLNRDFLQISILTLNQYFKEILKLLKDIIFESSLPSSYFEIQKQITIDKIKLEDSNNSTLAFKILQELVFGKNHPYGNRLTASGINILNLQDIKKYYSENIFSNFEIFLTGNFNDNDIKEIEKGFETLNYKKQNKEFEILEQKTLIKKINKKQSIQDSVILGKLFPEKTDEDYINLVILNELLGGYFGSRLMSNIREKSGYTYGIYSRIVPYKNASLFYIASEISKSYSSKVISEIIKEIDILKRVLVDKEELYSLKEYMKGKLLLSSDGFTAKMDSFINVHKFGLDNLYYTKFYNAIKNITPKILKSLANKYLDIKTFSQVIIE